jgi:hypothetical protein
VAELPEAAGNRPSHTRRKVPNASSNGATMSRSPSRLRSLSCSSLSSASPTSKSTSMPKVARSQSSMRRSSSAAIGGEAAS